MGTRRAVAVSKQPTEHPYVVRIKGVCGGRPTIKGTRISVRQLAELYKSGDTVDEILKDHPHLTAAAVYDAISYYLDHQKQIEREIAENRLEIIMKNIELKMGKRGFLHFAG